MLDGYIQILAEVRVTGDHVKDIHGEFRRVCIHQADPFHSFHVAQLFKEFLT